MESRLQGRSPGSALSWGEQDSHGVYASGGKRCICSGCGDGAGGKAGLSLDRDEPPATAGWMEFPAQGPERAPPEHCLTPAGGWGSTAGREGGGGGPCAVSLGAKASPPPQPIPGLGLIAIISRLGGAKRLSERLPGCRNMSAVVNVSTDGWPGPCPCSGPDGGCLGYGTPHMQPLRPWLRVQILLLGAACALGQASVPTP